MSTSIDKLISQLICVWFSWLKHNKIALNTTITINNRYKAAVECEHLICERYTIINNINILYEEIFTK